MKNPIYVLDSFAVLAYFQAEAGGAKVKDIQLITNQDLTPITFMILISFPYTFLKKGNKERNVHRGVPFFPSLYSNGLGAKPLQIMQSIAQFVKCNMMGIRKTSKSRVNC